MTDSSTDYPSERPSIRRYN